MIEISCSFCGRRRAEVRKLISGPNVYICDECVTLCNEIVEQDEPMSPRRRMRPADIVTDLDTFVVGQSQAKRALAVAVYNHYKRITYRARANEVELSKGNILLVGPTGCGKTLMAQALAKKLDVPFAIVDATALTEAGYVGEDVESAIKALYRAADGDVARTAEGIICIDEIDKVARRGSGPSATRDVSGEGVQQALLKLLEGRKAAISPDGSKNRPQQELVQIDTSNILFVLTGAFNGIEDIISQRVVERGMGFGSKTARRTEDKNSLRRKIRHEDLHRYGMIPEFMGRISVVVPCDELDVDAMVEVLWRPKNALIKQYQRLLAIEGVRLIVTEGAMRAISQEAISRKSGARGLRAIMEEVMLDVMYELPAAEGVAECVIDEDTIVKRERPKLIRKKKAS